MTAAPIDSHPDRRSQVGCQRNVRPTPKGRPVDPAARARDPRPARRRAAPARPADRAPAPASRTRYGHLSAAHIVALAAEMKLAMTEVYEVATFYHHFDVVKEGDAAPPPLTVRVCDSLSCEMAGAPRCCAELCRALGPACASSARRASAAATRRRSRSSARTRSTHATPTARRRGAVAARRDRSRAASPTSTTRAYRADGGYALLRRCVDGSATPRSVIAAMEESGLRGLGGAGFPAGRKWRIVRAEPAPRLMAVNIDEGEPGTFKDRWYLERDPHRFLEGMLIAAWTGRHRRGLRLPARRVRGLPCDPAARARGADRESALRAAADPAAARRRRLHLRRRVGDDRIDRRQARHAAAAPAVRRAGRPVRPADARAQHGDAVLGARHRRARRRLVRRPWPQRPQGPALVLGQRPRQASRACISRRPASRCAS